MRCSRAMCPHALSLARRTRGGGADMAGWCRVAVAGPDAGADHPEWSVLDVAGPRPWPAIARDRPAAATTDGHGHGPVRLRRCRRTVRDGRTKWPRLGSRDGRCGVATARRRHASRRSGVDAGLIIGIGVSPSVMRIHRASRIDRFQLGRSAQSKFRMQDLGQAFPLPKNSSTSLVWVEPRASPERLELPWACGVELNCRWTSVRKLSYSLPARRSTWRPRGLWGCATT